MGTKGLQTRRRLIDATAGLLEQQPLHDIRVADIARQANISAATFYLYFRDVSDVALAAINEHSQSAPELLQMIEDDWTVDGFEQARRFVDTYAGVWDSQAAIFRARNLAAEAGHPGFYKARERAVRPLFEALASKVAQNLQAGRLPAALDATAVAGVLLAMLERLSAVPLASAHDDPKARDGLVTAAAYLVATALQGHDPDDPGIKMAHSRELE